MFRRFVRLTVERERPTEVAVGGGKVRIEFKGAPEFRRRYVGLPPHECHKSEREVRPWIAVVELGRPSGKARSFLQLLFHHAPTEIA